MNQENNEKFSQSDLKYIEAYIVFANHYEEYIQENNVELHNRAVDFAKTFTENEMKGIEFFYKVDDRGNKSLHVGEVGGENE
jgi:hypothetical protein